MTEEHEFPQYDEEGEEILSFQNIWRSISPQQILGADCFLPNAIINNEENIFQLKVTGLEFRRMFSALYLGAEIAYPQEFMQIIVNFLRMVHCPPEMEDQECLEWPTYASFILYSPTNPYIQPDEIPAGYLTQPFVVNGQNGVDLPNFQPFDVIVPVGAITLDIDWFETIDGQLPTIQVIVNGAGKAFIKMLTIPLGGMAVITVDNPPDLIDIFLGIVTGAENIVDLNQDLISLPPETAQEVIFPAELVGPGEHTIYIVFLPIIDDSATPIRFGGGFRGVQLCNMVEEPEMGITDVRWNDALFIVEQQKNGEYEPIGDAATLSSYLQQALADASLALIQNTAQDIVINNHGDRLDVIEAEQIVQNERLDDLESYDAVNTAVITAITGDISALEVRTTTAESDIDTLDARLTDLEDADSTMWSVHYNFKTGEHGFGGGSGVTWTTAVGYSWSTSPIIIAKTDSSFLDGRIAFYRLELRKEGVGEQDYTVKIVGDIYSYGVAESGLNIRYHKLQSLPGREDLELSFAAAGSWILEGLTIFGYGDSNAFDD